MVDKSGDGADDVYVPKWIHYEWLHFLADFVVAYKYNAQLMCKLDHVPLPLYLSIHGVKVLAELVSELFCCS